MLRVYVFVFPMYNSLYEDLVFYSLFYPKQALKSTQGRIDWTDVFKNAWNIHLVTPSSALLWFRAYTRVQEYVCVFVHYDAG